MDFFALASSSMLYGKVRAFWINLWIYSYFLRLSLLRLCCYTAQKRKYISLLSNCHIQGPRTQIDAFQTNNFSWLKDIHVKSQWFLGSWDREIWYKTFNFYFINLTWPPQPQKAKVPTFLWDVGVAPQRFCHTLVTLAPRSWVLRLLYEVFFVSLIGLVPSES